MGFVRIGAPLVLASFLAAMTYSEIALPTPPKPSIDSIPLSMIGLRYSALSDVDDAVEPGYGAASRKTFLRMAGFGVMDGPDTQVHNGRGGPLEEVETPAAKRAARLPFAPRLTLATFNKDSFPIGKPGRAAPTRVAANENNDVTTGHDVIRVTTFGGGQSSSKLIHFVRSSPVFTPDADRLLALVAQYAIADLDREIWIEAPNVRNPELTAKRAAKVVSALRQMGIREPAIVVHPAELFEKWTDYAANAPYGGSFL